MELCSCTKYVHCCAVCGGFKYPLWSQLLGEPQLGGGVGSGVEVGVGEGETVGVDIGESGTTLFFPPFRLTDADKKLALGIAVKSR